MVWDAGEPIHCRIVVPFAAILVNQFAVEKAHSIRSSANLASSSWLIAKLLHWWERMLELDVQTEKFPGLSWLCRTSHHLSLTLLQAQDRIKYNTARRRRLPQTYEGLQQLTDGADVVKWFRGPKTDPRLLTVFFFKILDQTSRDCVTRKHCPKKSGTFCGSHYGKSRRTEKFDRGQLQTLYRTNKDGHGQNCSLASSRRILS